MDKYGRTLTILGILSESLEQNSFISYVAFRDKIARELDVFSWHAIDDCLRFCFAKGFLKPFDGSVRSTLLTDRIYEIDALVVRDSLASLGKNCKKIWV